MSKTENPMLTDAELEAFFTAARAEAPEPSDRLMARIMADAEAEIVARAQPTRPVAQMRPRSGLIAAVIAALGGWPAVAGMVTATVASVWLGFAAPDQLNTLAGGWVLTNDDATETSYSLDEFVPGGSGLGAFFEEG